MLMRCREFGMSGLKIKQSLAWEENLEEFLVVVRWNVV